MAKIERDVHQKMKEIFMTKIEMNFMTKIERNVHQKLEDKFMIKILNEQTKE